MVPGWKNLGVCPICRQVIRETDSGNITGHLDNCPSYGQAP